MSVDRGSGLNNNGIAQVISMPTNVASSLFRKKKKGMEKAIEHSRMRR